MLDYVFILVGDYIYSRRLTKKLVKQYSPWQKFIVTAFFEELINKDHLVRVVNEVVELMDIRDLINLYKGGGTSNRAPNSPIPPHILFWNENLDKKSTAHLSELYF